LQRNLPHLSYTLIMQAKSFSEMMVHSHHTTQHHILHKRPSLQTLPWEPQIPHENVWNILKQTWYQIYTSTRFAVFMPKTVIMIIFWDLVPCSLIAFQRNLLSLFSQQKCHWAAGSSKTLLPTYKTAQCYIPQYQILDNFSYKK